MTTYRLMDGLSGRPGNGPGSPTGYSGPYQAGISFGVTTGNLWLEGYYLWVPTGGDLNAGGTQKFALWIPYSNVAGTLVSAGTTTAGVFTANQWNYVPLATPIQLSIGTQYLAATGWTSVNGFPDTANQFGTGDPYVSGITSGPLFAYSDGSNGGTGTPTPWLPQGVFGDQAGQVDPTLYMPAQSSNSSNFWVDVSVSTVAPGGYPGSYRLYPNKSDTNLNTTLDSAVNYIIATEFELSQSCTLNKIWYYSPSGTAQLATSADIWSILGANSGSIVAGTNSPTWSGAAGSGWVSTSFAGVTLAAGSYKVSVFNNAGSPDQWSAKDAGTNYWGTGAGANGITWGPLSAPGLSTASLAYIFNGSNPGSTPPYTTGSTERGQCTFQQTGTNVYPPLYVDGLAQNYWLDVEVTPAPPAAGPAYTAFSASM